MERKVEREGDGIWVKWYGIWENKGRMKHRIGLGMKSRMGKWEMEWEWKVEWKKFSFIVVEEKDFLFEGEENFFHFGDISGKLF